MLRTVTLILLFSSAFAWSDADVQFSSSKPTSTDGAVAAVSVLSPQDKKTAKKSLQANITLHSLAELKQLLLQAEEIANDEGESEYSRENPIAVVLHGDEIGAFVRSNYRDHKELVDLAARLDAFKVIEVKVCQRWMGENDVEANELPPFVEPVPVGLGERNRLEKAGYAYF
jgi:intracellular sulfur oxidation DsrE/DsrF family protein